MCLSYRYMYAYVYLYLCVRICASTITPCLVCTWIQLYGYVDTNSYIIQHTLKHIRILCILHIYMQKHMTLYMHIHTCIYKYIYIRVYIYI